MQVCRICLQYCAESDCISFKHNVDNISVEFKLTTCVPGLNLHLVKESVLCSSCLTSLDFVYDFVRQSNEADLKIRTLLKNSPVTNLNEIYIVRDTKLIEDIKKDIDDQLEIVIKTEGVDEIDNKYIKCESVPDADVIIQPSSLVDVNVLKASNNKRPAECTECNYKTNRKQDLRRHMLNVHQHIQIKCKLCELKCDSKFNLHKHQLEAHTKNSLFSCDICNAKFKKCSILVRHRRRHSDLKPYICEICGQTYCDVHSLKQHMLNHTGIKPYVCTICNYRCVAKYMLESHMRTHTGEKPFLCELCGFQTSSNSHIQYHKQLHEGKKRFTCGVCDYQCLAKSSLNVHRRLHTGEKPYECFTCGYKAISLGHLKEHIRMHTGEKPFACEFCDHRTSRHSHLKVHMKSHPQYKPKSKQFKCHTCSFMTTIPIAFQDHVCRNGVIVEPVIAPQ